MSRVVASSAAWSCTLTDAVSALRRSDPLLPAIDAAYTPEGLEPGVYRLVQPGACGYRVVDTGPIPEYDVIHVPQVLAPGNDVLATRLAPHDFILAVVDPEVQRIYGRQIAAYFNSFNIDCSIVPLTKQANNEWNKSAETWMAVVAAASDRGLSENGAYLLIGGGVTADVGGFAASTTRRGVPYFVVPTTLTAAVDAAISPKTSINVGLRKNAAGTVYPPLAVLWDTDFIRTDPSFLTGVAEMIKIAIMRSHPLFCFLENHVLELIDARFGGPAGNAVVDVAISLFLRIKFEPPFVGNKPASLRSFGHAFSRRLEATCRFTLTHGEAVSIEMAVAASIAHSRGMLSADDHFRITNLLERVGLLPGCPECTADLVWSAFSSRYERGRPLYFPVPDGRIGCGTFLDRVEKRELAAAIARLPKGSPPRLAQAREASE